MKVGLRISCPCLVYNSTGSDCVNFETHANQLMKTNREITAVAVVDARGKVQYQSNGWNISGDISNLLKSWHEKSPSITVQGVKYSMLQCTPERLVTTNVLKKGHVVGAITPEGLYVIARTSPKGNYQVSYMDTARAADQMKKDGHPLKGKPTNLTSANMDLDSPLAKKEPKAEKWRTFADSEHAINVGKATQLLLCLKSSNIETKTQPSDPALFQEIDNFLQWIKNPQGLSYYIDYYLNQNNPEMIAKLARVYEQFRNIFGF